MTSTPPVESLLYLMPFGKHKGKPLGYILNHEPTYIITFLKRIALREPLNEHIQTVTTFHEAGGRAPDPIINEQQEEPHEEANPDAQGTTLDR